MISKREYAFSFAALLLTSCTNTVAPAASPDSQTREAVVEGYRQILAGWDRDGDGMLSRREWAAMSAEAYRNAPTQDRERLIAFSESWFTEMDGNGDGQLTDEELLRESIRFFDCLDTDSDGVVTQAEMRTESGGCGEESAVYLRGW